MRIFTAEQMADVDRHAIEELRIPGAVLMENAAVGLADAVGELFPTAASVAILCGPGNNGGDGLALARHLDGRGYGVRVFLFTKADDPNGDDLGGDAGLQLRILDAAGIEAVRVPPDEESDETNATSSEALDACRAADLVVDALFGTGLSRALDGRFADLVEALGDIATPLLAVDLPSGLSGSRAEAPGPHLRADATVTFAAPKLAHVLLPAADACGRILVTDLGLPAGVLERAPGTVHLTTLEEAAALVPARGDGRDTNKGTFGHVLVVAGRPGGAGAALLVTRAAVRAGAGLVTAAVPSSIRTELDLGSVESLTLPLDGPFGDWDLDALRAAAEDRDAVAIGPALGTDDATREALRRLVPELDVPMVLDADALGPFGGDEGHALLRGRRAETILTPHPGEMGRLLGCSTAEVQSDRLAAARRAAAATGCVVVLKGQRTVAAIPSGAAPDDSPDDTPADTSIELWIDPTGNSGLATGGTGDVLTGILGGLLAQGLEAAAAARLGVFLHGLAGDLAAETYGRRALAAGDVVDHLGAAWRRLLGDDA